MQNISDKFDELYVILEDRKRELIETVGREQDQKLGHVRSLIRRHGDHLEMSVKLVETAIQSMEEPQMAVFLQVQQVLLHGTGAMMLGVTTLLKNKVSKRCRITIFEMPFSETI